MFILSLLILIGSIGWLLFEPGWEPSLFALSSFSAVVYSEGHLREHLKRKIKSYKSKKILISEGNIIADDEELMKLMRPLCLGKKVSFEVINLEDDALEKNARKMVKDENEKYYKLAQINRHKKKLNLCSEGIKKIADLYRQGFINCDIGSLPNIVRRYVSIIYRPLSSSSLLLDKSKEVAFDIYSNSSVKGEISFIADIPSEEVDKMFRKLEINSAQDMRLRYFYSVLEVPERVLNEYIIPAQVSYGLTTFKEIANDSFWAHQNWAIGPH